MGKCECVDQGCPEHRGVSCDNDAVCTLYRIDMADETGTRFCGNCAADAMEFGLFCVE
jgi:hypothetical protein